MLPQTITNVQELEQVLSALLTPDSNVVRGAEAVLGAFTAEVKCIPALYQQLHSTNIGVKQMAAVTMRRHIRLHFPSLDENSKNTLKSGLLELVLEEKDNLVRSSIVQLIGSVAKLEITRWPDLAKFLTNCTKSQNHIHRELGMSLFATLIDNATDPIKANMVALVGAIQAGLTDPVQGVQTVALKTVGSLVKTIKGEKEVQLVAPLIPHVVKAITLLIQQHEDDHAINAFEIFEEITRIKTHGFDSAMPSLISFMFTIGKDANQSIEVRDRAITFVGWVIAFKPNILTKQKIVPSIIDMSFTLLVESSDQDDLFNDEITIYKCGAQLLDELAAGVPSKYIFNHAMRIAVPLTDSNKAAERKAGYTSIGIMAEGCHDPSRNNLSSIVPLLLRGMQDQDASVRSAANVAMSSCAEFLQPEIYAHHHLILPQVVRSLDESSTEVKEKVCCTLDAFCRYMNESILPYTDQIMTKLLQMLTSGDGKTQEVIASAISAVAGAAQKSFLPYAQTVLYMMNQIMSSPHDNLITLKGKAIECVGIVATAIGKEHFAPFFDPFMQHAIHIMKSPNQQNHHDELREYTFTFFENISSCLGGEFNVYLPQVMEFVMECLSDGGISEQALEQIQVNAPQVTGDLDGRVKYQEEEEEEEEVDLEDDEAEEIEEDDDDDDDEGNYRYVRTTQVEERASAINACGAFAKACGPHFKPYLPQALDILLNDSSYFHYIVRRTVMSALKNLLYVLIDAPLIKSSSSPTFSQQQTLLMDQIMTTHIAVMMEDADKETVALTCESICVICKEFGCNVLKPYVDGLMSALFILLQQQAPSNQKSLDEDDDHDLVLIDVVSDAVDDVARTLRGDFKPYMKQLVPILLDYMRPSRAVGDRIMALGTLGEVSKAMGHDICDFVSGDLFNHVMNGLKDSNHNIQRNAVFCAGVWCLNLKQQMQPHVLNILQLLYPIFVMNREQANAAVLDNACGTVARMILAEYQQLPVSQVLPVMLGALPLREDHDENEVVYASICGLLMKGDSCAAAHMNVILSLFVKVLHDSHTQEVVRNGIMGILKDIKSKHAAQWNQVLLTLGAEQGKFLNDL
ncbi:importin-beta [Acrasis kona]|uniref:Importin-beta n=1 Tax=Acrasis kona TaxID=1008807 RepID=A0AAW2Z391_9EUKA